jgi:hypothetical protein
MGYIYPKIPGENLIKKYSKVLIRGTYTKNRELLIDIAKLKSYSAIYFNAKLN